MTNRASWFFVFDQFRVDVVQQQLLRDGIAIPLTPKAYATLLALIQNRGLILSKDYLLKTVWPDTFVEEATLAQNIFTLRKALGGSEGDQYIQTISKRGYRFVANVTEFTDEGPVVADAEAELPADVVLEPETPIVGGGRAITSLAVLPLINASDVADAEHFSDGIMESIVNTLSLVPELRIKACSTVVHYKGRKLGPQDVGRELAVDSVLTGRLIRVGPNLLIRMELVDVMHGWQLWGEEYSQQLSNIHEFQRQVANDIAEKLRLKLTGEEWQRLINPRVQKAEANQYYLKGRYFLNQRTKHGLQVAIDCFEQAIEIDPTFALAYSGLADCYLNVDFYGLSTPWEVIPKARAAAVKALDLDHQLSEAHTSMGLVKLVCNRDLPGAEREFKQAIRLNPKYARALNAYAQCLREMGQIEKSLAQIKLALELDPFDLEFNKHLGWHYLRERQFDRSIEQLHRTLLMEPDYYRARILLGIAYGRKKLFSQAIEEFLRAERIEKTSVLSGFLGYAYAMAGKKEAENILEELLKASKHKYVPLYSIAIIYTGLGKQDEALDWIQKAVIEHSRWRGWLYPTAELDSLRSHPRFIEIVGDRFTRGKS